MRNLCDLRILNAHKIEYTKVKHQATQIKMATTLSRQTTACTQSDWADIMKFDHNIITVHDKTNHIT